MAEIMPETKAYFWEAIRFFLFFGISSEHNGQLKEDREVKDCGR